MAISTATVQRAYGFTTDRQEHVTISSVEYQVMHCYVDCIYNTVDYAQANDATFAPAAKIQAARRNGKTPTILQASYVAPGRLYLAAASTTPVLVGAGLATNSAGTVTHALTQEDQTTEMANAYVLSTSVWDKPIKFSVTFLEPLSD